MDRVHRAALALASTTLFGATAPLEFTPQQLALLDPSAAMAALCGGGGKGPSMRNTARPGRSDRPGAGSNASGHPAIRRSRQDPLSDHHIQSAGPALFRPGHGLCLWLQPCRGDRLLPGSAAARSRLRHVLVGRSAGLRPQHQCAAHPRRQYAGAEGHRPGARTVGQRHAARARADPGAGQALFGRSQCQAGRSRRRLCRRDADWSPATIRSTTTSPCSPRKRRWTRCPGTIGSPTSRAPSRGWARRSAWSRRSWRAIPTIRRRRTSTST